MNVVCDSAIIVNVYNTYIYMLFNIDIYICIAIKIIHPTTRVDQYLQTDLMDLIPYYNFLM